MHDSPQTPEAIYRQAYSLHRLQKYEPSHALCDRLEVDNSGRTLHGALLDAELLADVYINMTRGQDALLMDAGSPSEGGIKLVQIDLSRFVLPVVAANAQELAAHDEVLVQIDKSSGGKTLWRKVA